MYVYYIDMILPHLRLAGTYEKACRDYDLWEIDQRVSNYYYEITKRKFAQRSCRRRSSQARAICPSPTRRDLRSSKHRWL